MSMNSSVIGMRRDYKSWFSFLYVLFVLICFAPYEFWTVYFTWLPNLVFITQAAFLLVTIFVLITKNALNFAIHPLWGLFLIQLFGFALCLIVHEHIGHIIVRMTTMLLAISLINYINKTIGLIGFFKKYNYWLLLMALLGVVAWLLVSFLDFQPISVVPDRGADDRMIYNYILTFSKSDNWAFGSMRYSGFFDEPGHVAMWGLYAIIINKLFIKDKHIEYFLIAALLFTFSTGFYFQIMLYFVFFYTKRENFFRNIFLIILIILAVYVVNSLQNSEWSQVYSMTIGRIENIFDTSQGDESLYLDNRTDLMELAKNDFLSNPLFGSDSAVYRGDNVYSLLADYGIIGSLLILAPFIYLLILSSRYSDGILFRCTIIILAGFFHRPFQIYPLYFFIIYCIIFMYVQSKSQKAVLLGYK